MSEQILETGKMDLDNYSLVAVNKSAKFLREYFPNDLQTIYRIIEKFKEQPKVIFFNSEDFDSSVNFVIHGKSDYILELSPSYFLCLKSKPSHMCEISSNSRKVILKNLIPSVIALLFTKWNFLDPEEREYQYMLTNTLKEFLKNFRDNRITYSDDYEPDYYVGMINTIKNNPKNFVRVDILPHQLPVFKLRKKKINRKSTTLALPLNSTSSSSAIQTENYKVISKYTNEFSTILSNKDYSWIERRYNYKLLELKLQQNHDDQYPNFQAFDDKLDEEFNDVLRQLELIDGYGESNEPKLRELVESIIDDKLAGRSSNKLIIGPQGTGKSSFATLLGKLMKARVLTIECGPLTDNADLFGSYEIIIDPETRQAVTVYNENGFMYASKLVSKGEKIILAIEEYNLLPSETLLKQLNRFFQDRIISSMGGRHEISIDKKEDIIVIMTGNHDFNQDWLNDVGLIRRFEFFEFPLPSSESVVDCLFNYVINSDFNIRLSYEGAERIAEIRDDLVASLEEKTIRPILSKEVKYPDLYTLRNFALDLIHGVKVEIAVKRWLVKIILGGIPNEIDLREEYLNYTKIIQNTVEDRLPDSVREAII